MTNSESMLYFAYGSNLSIRRLRERVPSASLVTRARLEGHELRFHKESIDGSAKCDAFETGSAGHHVLGAVFEILLSEKPVLDRVEGLGSGYQEKTVELVTLDGGSLKATTYYATRINASLKPYHWYKEHVLIGAAENRFPDSYIQMIQRVESIDDPDPGRHNEELAIYF